MSMIPELRIEGGVCRFLPLTGQVEAQLSQTTGGAEAQALWLAGQLLDEDASDCSPLGAFTLTGFDDLLNHLLVALVGAATTCRATCTSCQAAFEFGLDLSQLRAAMRAAASGMNVEDGVVSVPASGRRFRLPRVKDMARLHRDGAEAWMRELLIDGEYAPEMEAEIALAAPVLAQDLTATCPECDAANTVRFDISDYLMRALRRDAGFLWREVHLIARTYGWPLDQILGLPRDVRRELAGLVVSDSSRLRVAS